MAKPFKERIHFIWYCCNDGDVLTPEEEEFFEWIKSIGIPYFITAGQIQRETELCQAHRRSNLPSAGTQSLNPVTYFSFETLTDIILAFSTIGSYNAVADFPSKWFLDRYDAFSGLIDFFAQYPSKEICRMKKEMRSISFVQYHRIMQKMLLEYSGLPLIVDGRLTVPGYKRYSSPDETIRTIGNAVVSTLGEFSSLEGLTLQPEEETTIRYLELWVKTKEIYFEFWSDSYFETSC